MYFKKEYSIVGLTKSSRGVCYPESVPGIPMGALGCAGSPMTQGEGDRPAWLPGPNCTQRKAHTLYIYPQEFRSTKAKATWPGICSQPLPRVFVGK